MSNSARDIMSSLEGKILSFDPRDTQDKIFNTAAFNRFFEECGFHIETCENKYGSYDQYVRSYNNEVVGEIKVAVRNLGRYLIGFNISYGSKYLTKTLDLKSLYVSGITPTVDVVYDSIANFLSTMMDDFLVTFGATN